MHNEATERLKELRQIVRNEVAESGPCTDEIIQLQVSNAGPSSFGGNSQSPSRASTTLHYEYATTLTCFSVRRFWRSSRSVRRLSSRNSFSDESLGISYLWMCTPHLSPNTEWVGGPHLNWTYLPFTIRHLSAHQCKPWNFGRTLLKLNIEDWINLAFQKNCSGRRWITFCEYKRYAGLLFEPRRIMALPRTGKRWHIRNTVHRTTASWRTTYYKNHARLDGKYTSCFILRIKFHSNLETLPWKNFPLQFLKLRTAMLTFYQRVWQKPEHQNLSTLYFRIISYSKLRLLHIIRIKRRSVLPSPLARVFDWSFPVHEMLVFEFEQSRKSGSFLRCVFVRLFRNPLDLLHLQFMNGLLRPNYFSHF